MKKIGLYLLTGLFGGLLTALLIIGTGPVLQTLADRFRQARTHDREEAAVSAAAGRDSADRSRRAFARLSGEHSPGAGEHSPVSLNAADAGDAAALEREVERLRGMNRQLQTQLSEILAWMLANYKGRYPLAENQITNLSFHAATESFELNPAVAEFLHLDSREVELITDLLSYGGEVVNELIARNIAVTESEGGKVVLHIPSFPEHGAILREDLYSALETTLGPARFDRFVDVTSGKFEADFNYFGDASHTIIFEPLYSAEDQSLQWRIRDGWIIQEEDSSKTIRATESIVHTLPEHYGKFMYYLPAYLFAGDEAK